MDDTRDVIESTRKFVPFSDLTLRILLGSKTAKHLDDHGPIVEEMVPPLYILGKTSGSIAVLVEKAKIKAMI